MKKYIQNILNTNMLGGLINMGNTCCFNTSLQCLYNVKELNKHLLSDEVDTELKSSRKEHNFLLNYRETLVHLLNNTMYKPRELLLSIKNLCRKKNINLHVNQQEDSHEILMYLLDWIHESIKYSIKIEITGQIKNKLDKIKYESIQYMKKTIENDYSIIVKLFSGQYLYKVFNNNDNTEISHNFENFNSLTLDITDKSNTLYDCLDNYTQTLFVGDNKYFYEKENIKIDATRKCFFWNLPNYLIISLKRFNYDNTKNNKKIEIPIDNFDLSKYTMGLVKLQSKYDLISVGMHFGGISCGHYTALTRKTQNIWVLYDDRSRTKISDINSHLNKYLNKVYYLIYKKKNNVPFEKDIVFDEYIESLKQKLNNNNQEKENSNSKSHEVNSKSHKENSKSHEYSDYDLTKYFEETEYDELNKEDSDEIELESDDEIDSDFLYELYESLHKEESSEDNIEYNESI